MLSAANCTSKVLLPFNILKSQSGDSIHKRLCLAFNHWFKLPQDKLQSVVESMDNLQNSHKLLDDMRDSSSAAAAAAHLVYGLPLTINASYYMGFSVLHSIQQAAPAVEVSQVYTQQLLEILRGRGLEIYWRDNSYWPSEEEYKNMVEEKVGGMYLLAARWMQLLSEDKNNYSRITKLLALYSEIKKDYCKLKEQKVQPALGDEGNELVVDRISLPIIHALRTSQGAQIQNILREPMKDNQVKRQFLSELDRLGSFDYTRDVLLHIDLETRDEVDRLGGNPDMEYVLDELMSWRNLEHTKAKLTERFTSTT